jgi:hypothetical protein
MKSERATRWPEVLIVFAALALAAAVPVSGVIQARIATNEAATIGDVRTVIISQAAYRAANGGWYESNFACLVHRGGCIPMSPTTSPTFLDSQLGSLVPRSGYIRAIGSFGSVPAPPDPTVSASSVSEYVYAASPAAQGQTGVRGFGGDGSGYVCFSDDGVQPPSTNGLLTRGAFCRTLQ